MPVVRRLLSVELKSVVLDLVVFHHDVDEVLHHGLVAELLVEACGLFFVVVGSRSVVKTGDSEHVYSVVALD